MITVLRAPPFATVQDLGRTGHMHAAVPRAGALDQPALRLGNALVGNSPDAAGIEWGLAGGELRFERRASLALTGAKVRATLGGRPITGGTRLLAEAGETLNVSVFERGAWLYAAIDGGIAVPTVLGSRATYLPGRFGGLEGRLLRSGDQLPLGPVSSEPIGSAGPGLGTGRDYGEGPIALLPGPDRHLLPEAAWSWLIQTEFTVSRAVSRMGYRLQGSNPAFSLPGDLASAPACVGTVQLPPGGEPIVLMPDGPTVGGYARVGVVAATDLGFLAQRRPGEVVRFRSVEFEEARSALRRQLEMAEH